jgi:transcription initiation factor TFIIH subunit 1
VEKFLDLAATEEDHGETNLIRDVTMQAGKERSSLPLIRRFNQHSEKLLRAGRQEDLGLTPSSELLEQIDMTDLHAPAAPAVIPLEVGSAASDDKGGPRGILPGRSDADLLAMADAEAARIAAWDADFASVCLPNPDPSKGGPGPGTKEYDAYAYQRDTQFVAQRVVRDMHMASNAEDAVYRMPFR